MKKTILTVGTAVLFIAGSVTFIGCGNSENKGAEANEQTEGGHDHSDGHSHGEADSGDGEKNTTEFSGKKVKDLSLILDSYFALKNGLSADNESKTAEASEQLLVAFKGFDKSDLDENQLIEYNEIEESAVENAEHIAKSEIYHQREHMVILSEDIKDLITLIGTDQKVYIDFCPMADNNKGAIWVSEVEEISNPYMGSKMPKCGKIESEIN